MFPDVPQVPPVLLHLLVQFPDLLPDQAPELLVHNLLHVRRHRSFLVRRVLLRGRRQRLPAESRLYDPIPVVFRFIV